MDSWKDRIPLASLTTFTLQDFPERAACILWFSGCQMRCPYCHNPDFAQGEGGRIDVETTLGFLRRRRQVLDGVTFSGGECLLSSSVVDMIRSVKEMGYQIKVDTNGGKPDRLRELMADGLIDYVALDFKAPLEDYEGLTGWYATEQWEKSFELLRDSGVECELRTTVHADLIDESSVDRIMDWLERNRFVGNYFIQHFQEAPRTLGNLGCPSRRFDLNRLTIDRAFSVGFRNFSAHELRGMRGNFLQRA